MKDNIKLDTFKISFTAFLLNALIETYNPELWIINEIQQKTLNDFEIIN